MFGRKQSKEHKGHDQRQASNQTRTEADQQRTARRKDEEVAATTAATTAATIIT